MQGYNDLAASIGMLNTEKDAAKEESKKKKEEEAAEKAKKKTGKEAEETTKRLELIPRFKQELQLQNIDGILALPDTYIHLFIH